MAALALAVPAFAQGLPPALDLERASTSPADPQRVLPVWNASNGRIEALLLIGDGRGGDDVQQFSSRTLQDLLAPPSSPSPGTSAHAAGLQGRADLGGGFGLSADLALSASPAMGLLCDGNVGLAAALGRLSEQCLLARLDDATGMPDGLQQRLGLGAQWTSADRGFDLSFGLSWLEGQIDAEQALALPTASMPGFGLLGFGSLLDGPGSELRSRELSLQGSTWVGPRSWLRVEGRHGQNRLSGNDTYRLLGLPGAWDSTSLSFSGGYRTFSGSITGRLIEVEQPHARWTDVDIAFSWRMPWDAKLSVGATNLLGGPDRGDWPAATLPGAGEGDARTPYVRYHQDL